MRPNSSMAKRYTVSLIDTSGDEPTIKRTNSYEELPDALNAVETLSGFSTFEGERIELSGGDSVKAWLDELQAQSEPRTKTPHYWTPYEGEIMVDPQAPHWSDGRVRVTEVTDTPASGYTIEGDSQVFEQTVAEKNPGEPEDAPVVVARYQRENGKESDEYAFPVTRLERA